MYVHPVLAPEAWQALGRADLKQGFAVANVANGPGTEPEVAYQAVLGDSLLGYVDSAYGARDLDVLVADLERWRSLYRITGVFLDQVTSHPQNAPGLVAGLREAGASRVVVNPGVEPDPVWCQVADVVVTFEGPWSEYQKYVPADWLRNVPPARLCHLVHSVPAGLPASAVVARTVAADAGIAGIGRGQMPNPWTGSLLDS